MNIRNTSPNYFEEEKRFPLYRVLAFALTICSVLALFLPFTVFDGASISSKWFGLFDTTAVATAGLVAFLIRFSFIGLLVATITFGLRAILQPEKEVSFVRWASLLFMTGNFLYTVFVVGGAISINMTAVDVVSLIFTVLSVALYTWLIYQGSDEYFAKNFVQFVMTLAFSALFLMSAMAKVNAIGFFGVILCALVITNLVFSCIRFQMGGQLEVDRIRAFVMLGSAVLLFVVSLLTKIQIVTILFTLFAIILSLAQIELITTRIKAGEEETENDYAYESAMPVAPVLEASVKNPAEMPTMERPIPTPAPSLPNVEPIVQSTTTTANGFRVEEYAEACPYEGGPVWGVEVAEEVNPTFKPSTEQTNQVHTAGYDFYNSKSFDPFIATLNDEERNQFTELFIIKCKGIMPEIPDYVVGGDNREFFRFVFIYLGQYRDRIPSGLLAKMYSFSIKLS